MLSAPVSGHPVRVIYAKLTSTGAYDVVARTPNLTLDDARTLAERLLPGNPPLDAAVGEEAAHVRPPEGGHIVWRFARYGWSDGDRGDVYITDIAWYAEEDFLAARGDAFALLPRTDQVFETATELPPFTAPAGNAPAEQARVAELHGRVSADTRTVVAGAAAAEPVLLIHTGERAAALELFTLLLPPRLRVALTFQSQAFRVPTVLPRLTLVDRGYANLRDGRWKVLPSLDIDVPLELAGRFVSLGEDPARLALAHELYEAASPEALTLRGGIAHVVALAEVAGQLAARDAAAVLRKVAALDAPLRAPLLARLRQRVGDSALAEALVTLTREPGEAGSLLLPLLAALPDLSGEAAGAIADAVRAGAPVELITELALRCARAGDLPRLIQLISLDRRLVASHIAGAGGTLDPEVRRLATALQGGSAAELLEAAAAVHPRLRRTAAAESLHRLCRDSVSDALDRAQVTPAALEGVLRLTVAADAYVAAAGASPALPPVMAEYELAQPDAADRAAAVHGPAARALLGGALLVRACEAQGAGRTESAERAAAHAGSLLRAADAAGVAQVRQALLERGVREHDLVALPGSAALLPLLGGNVQQAGLTRRIVAALEALGAGSDAAVPELAAAVLAAHGQRLRITAGGELSRDVLAALRALAGSPAATRNAAALDVCVELLSVITDAAHLPEVEDAALGDSMSARLQRLDRSVAHCRAVEREDRYERYALAIESPEVPLNGAARERLREALGTRGLQRRLLRAVSSVIARD